MKKKNDTNQFNDSVPQLDAMVVLLHELLQQMSTNKESMQIAREKAASVLVAGGITKDRVAKLLSMQRQKVIEAAEKISI